MGLKTLKGLLVLLISLLFWALYTIIYMYITIIGENYKMHEEKNLNISKKYDENEIQVLEGLEAVRMRPSMYIGSTDIKGLHHLITELVDNSIDEALAGYCDTVNVVVGKDGSLTVTDNGRGIPTGMHKTENKSAVEVVLTKLHAGGKFGGEGYKISGGLHGVGLSCVNALSDRLEVTIHQNNKIYNQVYRRGVPQSPLAVIGETDITGTTISFMPDPTIFETVDFDFGEMKARFREIAFLNKGITIIAEDHRSETPQKETYHFVGGIIEFVDYLNKNKPTLFPEPVYMDVDNGDSRVEIAFQYNEGYNEVINSYANNINTHEGGTHLVGFKNSLIFSNDMALRYSIIFLSSILMLGNSLARAPVAIII